MARAHRWPIEGTHIDETLLCVTFKGNPPRNTISRAQEITHFTHSVYNLLRRGNYIMKRQSVRQYPSTKTHVHTQVASGVRQSGTSGEDQTRGHVNSANFQQQSYNHNTINTKIDRGIDREVNGHSGSPNISGS